MIETFNKFVVTVNKDQVVSLVLGKQFSKDEAINLAAWLIVGVELADFKETDVLTKVAEMVKAIQSE